MPRRQLESRCEPQAGGAILLIEPDFLPVSIAEPIEMRTFWGGWLAWSRERGTAETAIYNGGSRWADYWRETIMELRGDLVPSGKLNDAVIDAFLAQCAKPALVDSDNRIDCRSRACAEQLSRLFQSCIVSHLR